MGYTSDSSPMFGSTIMGGAILLVLLFAIFNRNNCGGGLFNWGGNCGCGVTAAPGVWNSGFTDRDVLMSECSISKQILQAQNENQLLINQLGQRTDLQTATISTKLDANEINNLRDQLAAERSERLAAQGRIDALTQQIATNAQFQDIRNQLCQLGYAVSKTVQTPTFNVCGTYNPCGSCCGSNV